MSAQAPTRLVAGVDEAGLGPLLGPLTLGYSAFRVPQDAAEDGNLWKLLRSRVSRDPRMDANRLVVADSKVVYTRNPRGARRLEATALAFLGALPGGAPPTGCELCGVRCDEGAPPWYAGLAAPLPRGSSPERLEIEVARLARALAAARVELVAAGVHAVCEPHLNASFRRTGNKSATHWEATRAVLRRLWADLAAEGVHAIVDRQGARMRYAALLEEAFPGHEVEVRTETAALSDYVVRGPEGRARVTFAERAEERSFSVALASCLAKYARELCMDAFNAWFGARQPDLRPTAGYNSDGRRWLADAEPTLRSTGVDLAHLVRER